MSPGTTILVGALAVVREGVKNVLDFLGDMYPNMGGGEVDPPFAKFIIYVHVP